MRRPSTTAIAGGVLVAAILGLSAALVRPPPSWSMPDAVRIPIVKQQPGRVPAAAALFRHGTHNQFNCYACHPTLFPRYRVGFTHEQMRGGRFCAACHDGGSAFAIQGAPCDRCHVPE